MENYVARVKQTIETKYKIIRNTKYCCMSYLAANFNWCTRTFTRRIEDCLEWIVFIKQIDNSIMLGSDPLQSSKRKGGKFNAFIKISGLAYIYRLEGKKTHNTDGYLYALKSVGGNAVKVGKAQNLYKRLKSYTGHNTLSKCLWVKHVPNRHSSETKLIRMLQCAEHWHPRKDLGCEWFDCDFSDRFIPTFLNCITL